MSDAVQKIFVTAQASILSLPKGCYLLSKYIFSRPGGRFVPQIMVNELA